MKFLTRKMVKPADLNSNNTLFGGQILRWVDEEAAIFAACQLGTKRIVTKYISEVDFVAPSRQGEVIEIGVEAVKFGKSSLTLCVMVRNKDTKQTVVKIDRIVFVTVDEDGKPTGHGKTGYDDAAEQ